MSGKLRKPKKVTIPKLKTKPIVRAETTKAVIETIRQRQSTDSNQ